MDRRVKERLIGACILVVLAVAVVPELLSGPKPAVPADAAADAVRLPAGAPDPVRNVTVDLGSAKPALADAATPPAAAQSNAADGAVPTGSMAAGTPPAGIPPAGMSPAGTPPASAPSASAPPAGVPPAHALETPAALPTSGQTFAVQLGSFANHSNADKLAQQLKAQGFAIYVNAEGAGPAARYRVRVGPLADRDAAERMIAKLKDLGHAATIVSPR